MPDSETQRLENLYDQLRKKLLDLSKKNRMLNYSLGTRSKRHIQIVDAVLDLAYEKLAQDEASLRILPLVEPDDIPAEERTERFVSAFQQAKVTDIEYLTKLEVLESQGRDDEIAVSRLDRELRDKIRAELGLPPRPHKVEIDRAEHARRHGIDPNPELQSNVKKNEAANNQGPADDRLQTLKFPDELESIMEKISSDARLAEQEMGLSTLFMAFGFVEWYDSDASEKKILAPLLLLPVKIETRSVRGHDVYSISAREDQAETNLSLQKLIETNFNRKIPSFEDQDEDRTTSIQDYLERVRLALEGLARWQVHRWLVLGHFAFGRFAMYADLTPDNWTRHPAEHGLVSSILRGTENSEEEGFPLSIPEDYPIDDPEFESIAPFLIQDADASQHSALIDVMKESNLVIQGPPGTGKSQTITNIIANALAANKRILFLAEKQAALDVVKRRLTQAGLGEFCLELHSDRSSPKSVIESLKERTEISMEVRNALPPLDLAWNENRREIKAYLDALHATSPSGRTPFQLMWQALRGRNTNSDTIDAFNSVSLPDEVLTSASALDVLRHELAIFADTSASFQHAYGHPAASPWAELTLADLKNNEVAGLLGTLKEAGIVGETATALIADSDDLGLATTHDLDRLVELDAALGEPAAPDLLPGLTASDPDAPDLDDLDQALNHKIDTHRFAGALALLPDLSNIDESKLAIASAMVRAGLPSDLHKHTPAELFDQVRALIRRDTQAIEFVARFRPILQLFAFDHSIAAGALLPLAIAVQAGARVTPEHRPWISAHHDLDPATFFTLKARWNDIAQKETQWREFLEGFGDGPWPNARDLLAAAAALRTSGLRKAFAALTGQIKKAHELLARLGLKESPVAANRLEQLAKHVHAVMLFEEDEHAAILLGASWDGIATPFEEIDAGLRFRTLFFDRIGTLPYGAEVAERLVTLPSESFTPMSDPALVATATEFCGTNSEFRSHFAELTIEEVMTNCRTEFSILQKVRDLDRGRTLIDIALPIRQIAEIAELRVRYDSAIRKLDTSPSKMLANTLGRTQAAAIQAASAIAWIRAVEACNPPEKLKARLLSESAIEAHQLLRIMARRVIDLRDQHAALVERLESEFGLTDLAALSPTDLAERSKTLVEHGDELPEFLGLLEIKKSLADAGLGTFLTIADRIRLDPRRLPDHLETVIAHRSASLACSSPPLRNHRGATLDARRRQFAERDRKKIENDRSFLRTKLLANKPLPGSNQGPKKMWTEMALIRNEFGKQKRFVPVRSLLTRSGRSIQALKPCFMMSPLSLAKFVSADTLEFDLLVIDEASQMRPEDAIGGMLRAKQVVVVGDQKQLPPTDFFHRSSESAPDEEFEDIDDESILEGCQKAFRNVRRLKWHYRSRCESLIRFSNESFYKDSPLITFPAAKSESFSIDLVRIDGSYQARRNHAEAKGITQAAVDFMRHHAGLDAADIPTLGLVALNIDQRDLIQEELRRISIDDVHVREYTEKVTTKGEPLFVKNLENVQGDERDFIFISLTYGREPGATAVKQRFGPINGKQGHRRLNVLFTRARRRIGLFCSLGSTDIKPTEASQEGVHILRKYLEYAENRGRAAVSNIGVEPDSDFEIEVADRLRSKGYAVELQVGVSGFRIDLGVRHPDDLEHFLVGIECDGARYHSSKSARDRDRLREEILHHVGWKIIRVWSTDWFANPGRETNKLVKRLEELRSVPRSAHNDYPSLATAFAPEEKDPIAQESKKQESK